jgi:hypothetical protein
MFRSRSKSKTTTSCHLRGNLISFVLGSAFSFVVLSQSPTGTCNEVSRLFRSLQQLDLEAAQAALNGSPIPLEKEEEKKEEKKEEPEPKIIAPEVLPSCSCNSSSTAEEKSFLLLGQQTSTDKVAGVTRLPNCLETGVCTRPNCTREECRPWGHFYHTLYQQRLGKYSLDSVDPFQFLEIGFYTGRGYETYRNFLSSSAEVHSMEISCIPEGRREDGKVRN